MIVCFVDIVKIVDHHCLSFLLVNTDPSIHQGTRAGYDR